MRTKRVTDLVNFDEDAARTEVLFETDRSFSQVVCVQGAQGIGPMSDPNAEGLVVVLAGEVATQIGKARVRMKQWESAIVPPNEALTIRNASPEPSVVLLVLAPPPA